MQNLRVLIAEERDVVAARITAHLNGMGHQVLGVVRDSHAAVISAWRSQPDLILLDQHLPPGSGIEAARVIFTNHAVPLILLIGYPAAGLVRRAQQAGVLAYLVWPANARELGAAIEAAITRFREYRVLREQTGDSQYALRARAVVERAKRLLGRRLDLGEAEAFGYMHRQSQRTGAPIGEVAADLLAADELLFGKLNFVGCVDTILHLLTGRNLGGPQQVA